MKVYREYFIGTCLVLAAAFSQRLYAQYPVLTRVQDGKTLRYFGDKIAVKFKQGITPESMEKLAADFSATIARHHFGQWYTLDLPKNTDPFDLIPLMSQRNEVAYVELDRLMSPADDFSNKWGMDNTGQTINPPGGPITGTADADIDASEAWLITKGNASVRIGIVDTGIDSIHPDFSNGGQLASNFLILVGSNLDFGDPNKPWDLNGHGTRMTGNMAAIHGNNVGIRGVAPNCTFLPIRINNTSTTSAAEGVEFAAQNSAKVINASWGDPNGEFSQIIEDAILFAGEKDALVVAAGGNGTGPIWYPANYSDEYSNLITVTASDHNDNKAMPTTSGSDISVAAPGRYTYTTFLGQTWNWFNAASSSQATAYASGVAGLVRSFYPDLNAEETRWVLQNTADKVGSSSYSTDKGHNNSLGHGRINARWALESLIPPYYDDCGNLWDATARKPMEPHRWQGYDHAYGTTPDKTVSQHPDEVIYRYFGLTGKDQQGSNVEYRIKMTYYYEEPSDANPIQDLYIDNVLIDNNRIITSIPSTYTFDLPNYTWQTDHRIEVRFVAEGFSNAVVSEIWILESPPFLDGASKVTIPETDQSHPAVGRMRNYPNPFNPRTEVVYTIFEKGAVKLKVYNAAGQEVATLVEAAQEKGSHHASFEASHLSSGVYFSRLWLENTLVATQKMVFVK